MCPKIKGNIIFVALSSSSSPMICQAPKCDFKLDRHSTIYIAMFFTDIALFYLIPLVLSVIVINIREGDKTKRVFLKDHVLNLWTPPPSIPLRTPKVTFHQKWLFKVKKYHQRWRYHLAIHWWHCWNCWHCWHGLHCWNCFQLLKR